MGTYVILFVITLITEIIIVLYVLAAAQRRKILSSVLSATIEPLKVINLLIIVDSSDKVISVGITMASCLIGNYLAILLMNAIDNRKKLKELNITPLKPSGKRAA